MKPKYHTAMLRHNTVGASLVTAIFICLAGSACASDWAGTISTDWNDNANWAGGGGTGGSNAVINISAPNIATISANIAATPIDIIIGTGAGTSGVLDHTAGTATTGGGNWMFVGIGDGTGTYNLADTSNAGGGISGFAQGSGSMTVAGRLYVGGVGWLGGGVGTCNMNTSGTLAMGNDLAVGTNTGIGVMNVEAGTITTAGWNFIGKNDGGSGANGTLTMSGGTLTNTGRTYIGQAGCTGAMTLSGGSYKNINNEWFVIGEGAGGNATVTINNSASLLQSGGELWLGQAGGSGSMNLSAGSVTVNNWVAVGRDGGTGILNMTDGSIIKTGGGNFIVAASGPGTMTQSAGLVDVQGGETWVAETNNCTGTLTISGTAELRTPLFSVARNGGTNGYLNLDGGTVRTGQFVGGGGTKTVSFNGSQIIATGYQTAFVTNFNTATVNAGGLLVNSNGFDQTIPQVLGGSGGIVKSGNGTLTLTAANTNSGANIVHAGKLVTTTTATNSGSYTVADNTTLTVIQKIRRSNLRLRRKLKK